MPKYWSIAIASASRILVLSLLGSGFLLSAGAEPPSRGPNELETLGHRGIWDGRFTQAKSGLGWSLPDQGSSEGKRGTEGLIKPPMKFYYPTFEEWNALYDEIDRDDINATFKIKDYARAALIQVRNDIKIYNQPLTKGYYQVYLADHYSGSEKINLGHASEALPEEVAKRRAKEKIKPYTAVIFKKQGKVVAVAPISRQQPYKPTKQQEKAKKYPLAAVVEGPNYPLLEIYFQKAVYYVELVPAGTLIATPVDEGGSMASIPVGPLNPDEAGTLPSEPSTEASRPEQQALRPLQ